MKSRQRNRFWRSVHNGKASLPPDRFIVTARPGFTLVEIIVALAIAGVVVAVGVGAFSSIADHRRRADGVTEAIVRAASIRGTLRTWLVGATLIADEGGPPFRGIDGIRGDDPDDELVFLTLARTPIGDGPAIIRLHVDRDEETPETGLVAVIVEWRGTGQVRVEIDASVTGLDIRYLSGVRGERRWLASWISNTVLPAGLELRLNQGAGGELSPLLARSLLVPLQGR